MLGSNCCVELLTHLGLVVALYAVYPSRIRYSKYGVRLSKLLSFAIPSSFDPAPLLYPIFIPIFVALSLPNHTPALVLPNILLCLSSLPSPVIPFQDCSHGFSLSHWMVTLLPIIVSEHLSWDNTLPKPLTLRGLDSETLILVFPLQAALIPTLDFLLTTSFLPAELQLLATTLINLYLFAASPQMEVLKSLLWLGGMCIFITCRHVLRWEVALARIPSWKFRRSPSGSQSRKNLFYLIDHKVCEKLSRTSISEGPASDSDVPDRRLKLKTRRTMGEAYEQSPSGEPSYANGNVAAEEAFQGHAHISRRHTLSTTEEARQEQIRTTPSGRRKRSMAPGLASFLSMTVPQAQVRKWLYALYVYTVTILVGIGPVRKYMGERALHGHEPFGWAMGYLLGHMPWFRFWVLMWNLDHWIPLPPRTMDEVGDTCQLGWVEHIRQITFGEATTRLLVSLYCISVLFTGLAVVFRLSSVSEVDTRRKVFHGMMVLMFLPTTFIDPAFCALALAVVLSIFLLLDLFRASQLPPISRPLTHFLAPYVDGRDHRGPAIVSHIFLLIGCSIPLWLTLANIPRTGRSPWIGWDVVSRDVSMVSGVVCVGMGDAAASLIGRRFGRHKWLWGGGKSLEGSAAFAAAVSFGLVLARICLSLGRWASDTPVNSSWVWTIIKATLAAGGASTTEAILTGCNDNVVVPVVLWLLVRGLGI